MVKEMLKNIKEVFCVPLRFHWSVLLLPALLLLYNGISGIPLSIMIFVSLLFHEYSHVFIAQKEGLYVSHIITHGFGAAASICGLNYTNYKQDLKISVAGPIGSLFLFGMGLLLNFIFNSIWIVYFIYINLFIGIFNLLPLFPLDGGRILYSLLGMKFGALKAIRIACVVSWGLCVIGIIYGVFMGLWVISIVLGTIIYMSIQEKKVIEFQVSNYRQQR